ncbi:MAG: hypothetical protein EOP21_04310 [Hyphomicrobiales bacterium]|nr:MAG: hypothetical protein EOP21_04310 [Hyphomicrobiales bacterium]
MQMTHADFSRSTAIRTSLKRGLARQALTTAERESADLPALFAIAASLRPNPKGLDRIAARLGTRRGVTRVALTSCRKSLGFTARAVRQVEAKVQGETAFCETGLIYLRAQADMTGGRIGFRVSAVGFCGHALERLVERSDVRLDAPLLQVIDIEAHAILRGLERGAWIVEDGDEFYPPSTTGLWAGGQDGLCMEQDWGLSTDVVPTIPIFSVRTFLSPAEMRPTLYLRWKDDPSCRLL